MSNSRARPTVKKHITLHLSFFDVRARYLQTIRFRGLLYGWVDRLASCRVGEVPSVSEYSVLWGDLIRGILGAYGPFPRPKYEVETNNLVKKACDLFPECPPVPSEK